MEEILDYEEQANIHGAYAGFWERVAASLIDGVLFFFVSSMVFGLFFSLFFDANIFSRIDENGSLEENQEVINQIILLYSLYFGIYIIGNWLYHAFMESSKHQGTIGKVALGIVVVDMEGNRISFAKATGRHFAKIISSIPIYIGFIMAAFTEKKQTLHDIMATCLVVKK